MKVTTVDHLYNGSKNYYRATHEYNLNKNNDMISKAVINHHFATQENDSILYDVITDMTDNLIDTGWAYND